MSDRVQPYGGTLILREPLASARREMLAEAARLDALPVAESQLAMLEALATGLFSPLVGFMDRDQCRSVMAGMRLPGPGGLPWPVPMLLAAPADWVRGRRPGQRIALVDTSGQPRGILDLRDVFRPEDVDWSEATQVAPLATGVHFLGGPVWLLRRRVPRFPRHEEDPSDVRTTLAARGWRQVALLPVRDVVHRDGEYILKTCLETVDGVLLHAVVADADEPLEFPAALRMRCLETLLRHYLPPGRVHLAVQGLAEPIGGPRRALLAGILARNLGCSHVIITPEVAGEGGGEDRARALYEQFGEEIGTRALFFSQPVHCDTCGGMATDKTCPHGAPDRVMMTRERLRRLLLAGIRPPGQYTRPEIADILCDWARGTL